jgi:hypothetical protein
MNSWEIIYNFFKDEKYDKSSILNSIKSIIKNIDTIEINGIEGIKGVEGIEKKDETIYLILGLYSVYCDRDYDKALEYFIKGKTSKFALGMVGSCFAVKENVEELKEGINYIIESINDGYKQFTNDLAIYYENFVKDYNKAFQLYTEAVNYNCPSSLLNLALCYKFGIGTEQDVYEYLKLATKELFLHPNNYNALVSLGIFYHVNNNIKKAERYMLSAYLINNNTLNEISKYIVNVDLSLQNYIIETENQKKEILNEITKINEMNGIEGILPICNIITLYVVE